MSTAREACYVALFAFLQTLTASAGIVTVSRKFRYLEELAGPELPALFLVGAPELMQRKHGLPRKLRLGFYAYLYVANPDSHVSADTQLNQLIDAVETCLEPLPGLTQTLGGVVEHCWIEGEVPRFAAAKSQRAAAIVPIHIMVP